MCVRRMSRPVLLKCSSRRGGRICTAGQISLCMYLVASSMVKTTYYRKTGCCSQYTCRMRARPNRRIRKHAHSPASKMRVPREDGCCTKRVLWEPNARIIHAQPDTSPFGCHGIRASRHALRDWLMLVVSRIPRLGTNRLSHRESKGHSQRLTCRRQRDDMILLREV